jgi:hypothetical protein
VRVLALLLCSGCFSMNIDARTERDTTVSLDFSNVVGPCDGQVVDGDTTVTFTQSTDGKTCTAHVSVAGSLIDVADLKQQYRDEVDGYPDTSAVTATAMHAQVTDVALVDDAGGQILHPTINQWSATFTVDAVPVATLGGADADSLFGGIPDVDLQPAVALLNTAVDTNGTLAESGQIDVALDTASIAVALAGHTGVFLSLKIVVHLDLRITTHLKDQL